MDSEIALNRQSEETGVFVADVEAAAMQRAYQRRNAQNTNLFVQQHCDYTSNQIGERLADIQAMAKREALLGFLWRWGLIGGGGAFLMLFVTVDFIAIAGLILISVPVSIGLSLRK